MWRIVLAAVLTTGCFIPGRGQEILISRYTFNGNSASPDSVHRSVLSRDISLAPIIPVDCESCPFVTGSPSSGPAFGSYGWPSNPSIPDTSRYIQIPLVVSPGHSLELMRLSFEIHRENQAASKWQLRYSKNNFASALASGLMIGHGNWSTVTIPLSPIQPLQALTDLVIFRIYPFNANKEPTEDKNTIWRIDSVRIYNAGEPLPVELTAFTAAPVGPDIRLEWATATENNSEYFGIEHARNGEPFQELNRVPAAGWSVAMQSYLWMHRTAGPGQHYYRLNMVDRDRMAKYSPVITAKLLADSSPMTAWIQSGFVHVGGLKNHAGGILSIWNVNGDLITRRSIQPGMLTTSLGLGNHPSCPCIVLWESEGEVPVSVKVY